MIRRLFLCLALPSLLAGAPPVVLWPAGAMPGKATTEPETAVPRNDGFTRITHVSRPILEPFPVEGAGDRPAPAVIICPGGGYRYVVVDKEGSEIAKWLNAAGISAFVLRYRTPDNREGALQDAQRSIRIVRSRAAEWRIDPAKIGIIGFSAGGHVAARASTRFGTPAYAPIDPVDETSARPDFAMLVYPAYLDDKKGGVTPELDLAAPVPPTLIVHTGDDKSFIAGSKAYAAALATAKRPHRFLLYPTGGHGYGRHCQGDAKIWPDEAARWLGEIGVR